MHAIQILPFKGLLFLLLSIISWYLFKKFPKKPIVFMVVLIVMSFLPLISIFRPGTYESGDLTLHIMKTMDFYQSLTQGEFFPRWAGTLNAGYGYPHFVFAYPLPYCAMSLLHWLGFSFILSAKVFLAFAFVASGISMFLWIQSKWGEKAGLVSSLFYLYAPYHLIDLHFRATVGEVGAFVFIPLVCFAIDRVLQKKSMAHWVMIGSASYALLILSHQAVAVIASAFYVTYIFFQLRNLNRKLLIPLFSILMMGLLFSAFYWLPVVGEKYFVESVALPENLLTFTLIKDLMYSPWMFGWLFQGPHGELVFPVGYVQWIIALVLLAYLFSKKFPFEKKKKILFWLAWFGALIFLITPMSKHIWEYLPLLNQIQFSYRLMVMVSFVSAVMAGWLFHQKIFSDRVWFVMVFIMIGSSILNWANRQTLPETNDQTIAESIPHTARQEVLLPAVPLWFDVEKYWKSPVSEKILKSEEFAIETNHLSNHQHLFEIDAKESLNLTHQTMFYPGWQVLVDSEPVLVSNVEGLITFPIPQGRHQVEVVYRGNDLQYWGEVITIGSVLGMICFLLFSYGRKQ